MSKERQKSKKPRKNKIINLYKSSTQNEMERMDKEPFIFGKEEQEEDEKYLDNVLAPYFAGVDDRDPLDQVTDLARAGLLPGVNKLIVNFFRKGSREECRRLISVLEVL